MPKRNDPAHKETDIILSRMEQEVRGVYTQAYKEARQTADDFMKKFQDADAQKREALKNGDIDKEEYARWQRTQLFQGKRFQQMADTLSKDMANSNKIAASIINGHLPEVYALNHNYGTYEMEHGGRVDTQYTLYDRQTVERLLRDDPNLLPQAKVDIPADIKWSKKTINSAITQGILQGDDVTKISQRLAESVTSMSRTAAIRNARTMTTSAENGGRIDSYKRAEKMGIKMLQVWMATLDGRTRHEHRQLDGQKRKVGEPFEVDGYKIEFPADPKAEAFLVYNCRCTLVGEVEGVNLNLSDTTQRDNKLGDMSYQEWKEDKRREEPEKPAKVTTDFFPVYIRDTVNETIGKMNPAVGRKYQEAIDNCPKKTSANGTAYNPDTNTINYNVDEVQVVETDTILHETTHYIDYNTPKVYENRSTVRKWARDENGDLLEKDGKPYKVETVEVFKYDCKSCTSWISFSYDDDQRVEDWKKAASIIGVTEKNSTPLGEVIDSADLKERRDKFNKWVKDKDISFEDLPHISDVMSSFLEGQLPFSLFEGGHDESYWNNDIRKQYSECIAAYSVLRSRNSKSVGLIKEICPNLYGYLEIVYKEMFGV